MSDRWQRRGFLSRLLTLGGAGAGAAAAQLGRGKKPPPTPETFPGNPAGLGNLYRARAGKRKRSSSYNRQGRNADAVKIEPGSSATVAEIKGAGCVRHVWMTISSPEPDYLRRLVLRAWWDGEAEPSVETPVGDFFGVGHGRVSNYWSLPLNMVTGGTAEHDSRAAMNCFFPMPFGTSAKITLENEGSKTVNSLYYHVDYEAYDKPVADALRFHAHWRRERRTRPSVQLSDPGSSFSKTNEMVNLDGSGNYVILEAQGRGHYVGCNLSIDHINPIPNFPWFGEGDDMMFIDGETTPSLVGTGTEDYFCAAWGFPGGHNSMPYHGVSLAGLADGPLAYSGKWTMYRYHVEDPVMFEKSLRVTIEAGHANVHANDYSSVGYWYQAEPHRAFPAMLPVAERLPLSNSESLREFWKTR